METETWADYIFGGQVEGWIYVMLAEKGTDKKQQVFYRWPEHRDKLLKVNVNKTKGDLYFCPSLFRSKSGKKSEVLGSHVSWIDLDKELEGNPDEIEEAGLVIYSGGPGRSHRYWKNADGFLPASEVESRNLYLCKVFEADKSGWDANQLLRIPSTLNHKTDIPRPTKIASFPGGTYSIATLSPEDAFGPSDFQLLSLEEVLFRQAMPKKAQSLYIKGSDDRSRGLSHLAFLLAESGYSDDERYTLLVHADARWGKFHLRDDSELQLGLIVQRTRLDVEFVLDVESGKRRLLSRRNLRDSPKAKIDWIYEGFLQTGGFTVVAGQQGVGKSQLALQLASDSTLSRDFVGLPFVGKKQQEILWLSLEMDQSELGHIVLLQTENVDPDEDEILESNLAYDAVGHAIYLDTKEGQEEVETMIAERAPTGVVIDSLSASVKTSLKDDVAVRAVFDFIDRMRAKYKVWIVLVTHPRKQPAGVKVYERGMDDLYGDSLITQRPSSVCLLTRLPHGQFEFRYLKTRSAELREPLCLGRSDNLTYKVEEPKVLAPTATVRKRVQLNEPGIEFDSDGID